MKAMGKGSVSSFLAGLLTVAWYLAVLLSAVAVVCVLLSLFVAIPGLTMSIPVSLTMNPVQHVTAPSLGIAEAEIKGPGDGIDFEFGEISSPTRLRVRGSLRFPARRGGFLAANMMIILIGCTGALWVLSQLRAVFDTLRRGQPFVRANAKRIRSIAFAVIAGELVRAAVAFFENYYAMAHFTAEGLHFDARPDLNMLALVEGLIILVIAEVFRAGTRLDEEQSLTI